MGSWGWVANTLKNLRVSGPSSSAIGPAAQSRSPPLFGAQAATSIPAKPKKPLTPYFRFLGKVREDVKKENPSVKPTELMKKVGQRWDQLDEASKSSYMNAYKKDMESYQSVIQKYHQSLSPEQKELQQQMKLEKQMKKDKREKRRRLKELGKPKKPVTGFLAFLNSKVSPGASITDYQTAAKELGPKWKAMSEADKAPFLAKYKTDLQQYEKELHKWEEKMIKQGNQDLVRQNQLTKSTRKPKSK